MSQDSGTIMISIVLLKELRGRCRHCHRARHSYIGARGMDQAIRAM